MSTPSNRYCSNCDHCKVYPQNVMGYCRKWNNTVYIHSVACVCWSEIVTIF